MAPSATGGTSSICCLDDCNFNSRVDLARFDAERVLQLVPPEGGFTLMQYRSTYDFAPPFRVFTHVEGDALTAEKCVIMVQVRTRGDSGGWLGRNGRVGRWKVVGGNMERDADRCLAVCGDPPDEGGTRAGGAAGFADCTVASEVVEKVPRSWRESAGKVVMVVCDAVRRLQECTAQPLRIRTLVWSLWLTAGGIAGIVDSQGLPRRQVRLDSQGPHFEPISPAVLTPLVS